MKKQIKGSNFMKEEGITLIALVITIIVLLILSAVTIMALTGENGLLTKASNAKEETSKETATEKINLKITSAQMKSYAEKQEMPDLQYLANELDKDTGENGDLEYVSTESQKEKATARNLGRIASTNDEISVSSIDIGNSKSIFTKLKEYPYEFEINSSLKLASIDGVEIADTNTVTKEQYDELLSEISALRTRVEKLETDKLTYTELARTTSASESNTVTLNSSLSNYKYVVIAFKGASGNDVFSGLVPVEAFKTSNQRIASTSDAHWGIAIYISDTSCAMRVSQNSGGTAILYGIK